MNDAIDITASQRKTVRNLLERHLPDAEVWVYGSRANWTAKPESDLDMVVFTSPEQARKVFDLREAFEESSLPFRVDLFVWNEIPDSFKANINKQHVVLQEPAEKTQQLLRAGWTKKKWGDLASLEYGKALRGYQNADGPYRVFGTNGPIGRHTEPLCNHPTVIVGRKGAYRGIHYSDAPCFLIDPAFYLEPKTDFDMKWAYYELLTHDINAMDSGSAIPSTSRDSFYQLPVRVPPLPEQKTIAHILGTLDDKIELNRRMNETLEGIARAIFKSWFVDFDPVRAKAEGRDTGLPKEIEELFPDAFGDSELGEIPKGWTVATLKDKAVKTVFPPEELATAFHNRVRALDEKKVHNERQGAALHAIRQRLLGPLLAGNLCVSLNHFSEEAAP